MSSDNASSAVTYMSISSYSDGPSWGIPLMNVGEFPEMDPYEEVAQQGQATPLSPAYVPESIIYQRSGGRSEEDPIDYAADTDDDGEDKEEEESSDDDEEEEEHLAPTVALSSVDPVPSAEETDPFETDESAATPPPQPPAYRTTSRMSVRRKRLLGFLPYLLHHHLHSLHYHHHFPKYHHHPLPLPAPSTSRRANILEAELSPQKRLLLTAPTPRFEIRESSTAATTRQLRSTVARRVDYGFVDTLDASIRGSERESEEFQTRHQDAKDDHAALRDEVDTLRMYRSSLCTTHKQERVEARQALDRSEAYIRALEARIAALEARARVDTLEDTGSSA
ncbi:hypothetical protein Tco_1534044 [Tanacetum coccineum]